MAEQTHSLKNNFLIAMPSLDDDLFHQSVVYICDHNEQGAMGLIINQPSEYKLDNLLDHFDIPYDVETAKQTPIYIGGPVEKEQGLLLHNCPDDDEDSVLIGNNIFLSSSADALKTLAHKTDTHDIRITLGYASWYPGQLEQEIADNAWLTSEADNDILFNSSGQQSWQRAAGLLGIDINLMTNTAGHA